MLATPGLLLLGALIAAEEGGRFEISARDGDVVSFSDDEVFEVTCPRGIGRATIRPRNDSSWPDRAVFRLRYDERRGFKTLEGLTIKTPQLSASGFLGEEGGMPFRFAGDTSDSGTGVDREAGRLNVKMTVKETWLEIELPQGMLRGSSSLEMQWVDAYRQ